MQKIATKSFWATIALLLIITFTLAVTERPSVQAQTDHHIYLPIVSSSGRSFYVSKEGNNTNGRSWSAAWNELDQIDWAVLQPGDVVYIDGGENEMTYFTTLRPNGSGTSDAPITVVLSAADGRDGRAVFFGGNSVPLPECGQLSWDESKHADAGIAGIFIDSKTSHVVIDGRKRGGFQIHGWQENGVKFNPDKFDNGIDDNAKNITLRYMEIFNNGGIERKNDGAVQNLFYPDHGGSGVKIAGSGHRFSFLEVHDNAGDGIQSAYTAYTGGVFNNMDDFTLTDSWLYNQRPHSGIDNGPSGEVCTADSTSGCDELGAPQMGPDYHKYPSGHQDRQESFNWCTHSDGIQIYSSNAFNTMRIERTIIGPNFMHALILGDRNGPNHTAWINNLTLQDVVLTRYMFGALGMKSPADSAGKNWNLNNVTIYGHHSNFKKGTLHIDSNASQNEHQIANSIMVHGRTSFPKGNVTFNNNCDYGLYDGSLDGREADPDFVRTLEQDLFESDLNVDFATVFLDDYTVQNVSCSGSGSRVASVGELLARFNQD